MLPIHPSHTTLFPYSHSPVCENLPLEWGRLWRLCLLSLLVALVSHILLFCDDVVVFGSVGVAGAVGSGGVDVGLAGRFELFECLLDEGDGVFVRAATFHVCCDVGPEGGGVGVFDFFFGGEEVLFLSERWWLVGLRE